MANILFSVVRVSDLQFDRGFRGLEECDYPVRSHVIIGTDGWIYTALHRCLSKELSLEITFQDHTSPPSRRGFYYWAAECRCPDGLMRDTFTQEALDRFQWKPQDHHFAGSVPVSLEELRATLDAILTDTDAKFTAMQTGKAVYLSVKKKQEPKRPTDDEITALAQRIAGNTTIGELINFMASDLFYAIEDNWESYYKLLEDQNKRFPLTRDPDYCPSGLSHNNQHSCGQKELTTINPPLYTFECRYCQRKGKFGLDTQGIEWEPAEGLPPVGFPENQQTNNPG